MWILQFWSKSHCDLDTSLSATLKHSGNEIMQSFDIWARKPHRILMSHKKLWRQRKNLNVIIHLDILILHLTWLKIWRVDQLKVQVQGLHDEVAELGVKSPSGSWFLPLLSLHTRDVLFPQCSPFLRSAHWSWAQHRLQCSWHDEPALLIRWGEQG